MSAATTLAYTDAKEDFKENPYAVLDVKHAHQLSEINAAGSWRYQTEQLRGQNRMQAIQAEAYYDEFSYSGEPKAPKSSGGSKSGSGSGKKVSDEQVAQAQEILNNPLANQQAITEAKSVLKKHEEQQEFNVFDAFKLLDSSEGSFLKGQDLSKLEKQSIGTLFDQKGKAGMIGLLKVYDQAIQNGEMTTQQFYDAVKPAGSKAHAGYGVLKRENLPDPAFTSPKEMIKKIESEGVDFLLKHTNKESQDVMIKNYKGEKVRDAMDVERKKFAGYKEGTVKYSDNIKDNYMASFLANGTSWLTKNSNLTTVKSAMRQGLDTELAIANTISKNVQDSRKWRYETRELVADDVYNSLKNDPTMIREFGTAKFDKNGKYLSTDMSRLREEIGNMYDESGNINPNYKLKTNYITETKNRKEKMQNDPAFKMLPEFVKKSLLSNFSEYELRPEYRTRNNQIIGAPMYTQHSDDYVAPKSFEEASNLLNKQILDQFTKSARDIYSDVGNKHIIGDVPGFVKKDLEGGSGFGMRPLTSRIDLSKPNSLGAITFWEFTKDWANLRNSIDGIENVISFEGASPTGYKSGKIESGIFGTSFFDRSYEETSSALGKRLLDDYMEWTKEHGTKANAFDMIAQRVAAEDITKGSMKIKFPEKFLKEMLLDEEKNPNGYIEQTDYDKLIQNGLTVIAPNTKFNNSLHNSTMSPLQSHVEYNDKYTWNHPSGLGSFTIRKGDPSDPDYITETTYKDYNGEIIESVVNRSTTFGPNLESALGSGIDDLNGWVYDDLKKFSQQQKNIQMQSSGNAQK
jgi:hypothetical protein